MNADVIENPVGFGSADFIALALAALFGIAALVWQPFLRHRALHVAANPRQSMILLALLPVVLRLLLLPTHPVPTPDIYDEFSHLLEADTLLHLRLANPAHPFPQFFETFFILQQPTYSSIYPPGQGLLLAFGRAISGQAWTGVVLATAAFCSLAYWMLRAWTTPAWALAGGLLSVIEFGPLNSWMNSYWGGTLPALAGCLVFGALPRLQNQWRKRDALFLGIGLGIQAMTRPFESLLLLSSIALFFILFREQQNWRKLARTLPYVAIPVAPCLLLVALQNKEVTGHWTTFAEQLSQFQYGVPTTLTVQPAAVPHRPLTPPQQLDYEAQALTHGPGNDTFGRFLLRLEYRVRYYRFFFLPPLYVALVAFLFAVRWPRMPWVIATLIMFALGLNLFPYLLPRYLAAVTCLFLLVSVTGLRRLYTFTFRSFPIGREAAGIILLLCGAHFVFWYGLHLLERVHLSSQAMEYETWDAIKHSGPQPRTQVADQLAAIPGKLLVFVRYWPQHRYQDEWVWNAADIDNSRIVMARDLGAAADENLIRYYPDRKIWLLEPDAVPPHLSAYTAKSPSQNNAPQPNAPFTDVK